MRARAPRADVAPTSRHDAEEPRAAGGGVAAVRFAKVAFMIGQSWKVVGEVGGETEWR